MSEIRASLIQSVFKLLRPLVRVLLQQGLSYAEFAEIAKKAYVDVAEKEFQIPGRKQSIARICVLTGIHRKDVNRLLAEQSSGEWHIEPLSRAARVIGGWLSDSHFLNKAGRPDLLPFDGEAGSFSQLVKRYSGDMPARAVLDELKRAKAVEVTDTGKLKLVSEAYVPVALDDQILQVLGMAGSDLLNTIGYNLTAPPNGSRLQLSVAYDRLSPEVVREFKQMAEKDALNTLKRYNAWLAERDADNPDLPSSAPDPRAPGTRESDSPMMRAGLGMYYFEEPASLGSDQSATAAGRKSSRKSDG